MNPGDYVPGNIDPNLPMFADLDHPPVSSFDEVLEVLDSKSETNAAKGRVFELLTASFFRMNAEPEVMFETVWTWSGWPEGRGHGDMGIDLVARRRENQELVAIQCKFYGRVYPVKYDDVANFLVASRLFGFKNLMLVATTGLTRPAEFAVERWSELFERDVSIDVRGPEMFEHSQVNWTKFNLAIPVNMILK